MHFSWFLYWKRSSIYFDCVCWTPLRKAPFLEVLYPCYFWLLVLYVVGAAHERAGRLVCGSIKKGNLRTPFHPHCPSNHPLLILLYIRCVAWSNPPFKKIMFHTFPAFLSFSLSAPSSIKEKDCSKICFILFMFYSPKISPSPRILKMVSNAIDC